MRSRSIKRNVRKAAAVAAIVALIPLVEKTAKAQEPESGTAESSESKPPMPLEGELLTDDAAESSGTQKPKKRVLTLDGETEISGEKEKTKKQPPKKTSDKTEEDPVIYVDEQPVSDPKAEQDPIPGIFATEVDPTGKLRPISLAHAWDIGGNVVSNEAGSSVYGSVRYTLEHKEWFVGRFSSDSGNIWFGQQAAPFTRLFASPQVKLWRFKGATYTSLASIGNMPSWFHWYQSGGLGYSQGFGGDSRLRLGVVGGWAMSAPTYDNIYADIAMGASFEAKKHMVYAIPTFMYAASNPIQVAYYEHYKPRFQDMEFGAQTRFWNDQYTARAFYNFGLISQKLGGRLTRTINFSNTVAGDLYGGLGATRWASELGGRWDPMVVAGINVVLGGQHINSTNTFRYERIQPGRSIHVKTERPTRQDPGPYGFGRSGNPEWDAEVNRAKDNLLEADSFDEFAANYRTSSRSEVIRTARFIGAFMSQVAYANDAYEDINSGNILSSEAERISHVNTDVMYSYLRAYVDHYEHNAPNTPLPENLRRGIAMCGGIHGLMADFMRRNGVPAIVASVNTPNGPHMVAIAQPPGATVLLDYGVPYEAPGGMFDEVIRAYGHEKQAPVFQSQLFGANGYMGTYITSEGRLLHESIGIINSEVLKMDFLNIR
ncbi:hypothetical protein JXA56_04525 [Candidatus Micrarchaeota archaeon]|nr:hypothetical protein [Candidatus Micrarchaeota archaeon]